MNTACTALDDSPCAPPLAGLKFNVRDVLCLQALRPFALDALVFEHHLTNLSEVYRFARAGHLRWCAKEGQPHGFNMELPALLVGHWLLGI